MSEIAHQAKGTVGYKSPDLDKWPDTLYEHPHYWAKVSVGVIKKQCNSLPGFGLSLIA